MSVPQGRKAPPLISVVIPTRNRIRRLLAAVLSVLRQGGDRVEVIVVDDASSLDMRPTYDLLRQMGVEVLHLPQKRSGSAARNVGAAAASAELVSFLDSDDVWLPGLADRILTERRENTVFVAGVLLRIGDEMFGFRQPEWRCGMRPEDFIYRDGGRIQTSMLTLPRDVALSHPFREALRVNQDSDFAIRLAANGVDFRIDTAPGIIKDESDVADRLTLDPELSDLSFEWFRSRSGDWSPAARRGFYLRDRVWRLANSGRGGEAALAWLKGTVPPVSARESLRLAAAMTLGRDRYARFKGSVRAFLPDARRMEGASPARDWLDTIEAEARELLAQLPKPAQRPAMVRNTSATGFSRPSGATKPNQSSVSPVSLPRSR